MPATPLRTHIRQVWSCFLLGSALFLPQTLHAQDAPTCDIANVAKNPADVRQVDAASTTKFLPGGSTGQILVKSKDPTVVRIFEVQNTDPSTWTPPLPQVTVTSVKSIADKTYEGRGFFPSDSSLVNVIVPNRADWLWGTRSFAIIVCGKTDGKATTAYATISAPVSSPIQARAISAIVLLILYIAFAYAIYRVYKDPHPPELTARWPAYDTPQKLSWYGYLDPVVLTAGVFNQGSIQKLQVLLFTFLVGGMVLSLVLTLGMLTDLSSTVAMLLGISAVGAAVGQKTTTSNERIQFDNWAWLVHKNVLPIHRESTPQWSDLVMTGREFDVYKLQTLIFSGVVAVALVATGEDRLGSFEIPATLLGILGLSQVVYVAGALVRPPSIADLDKALTELRELETKLQVAIAYNVDIDKDGKLPTLPAPAPLPPLQQRIDKAVNAKALYDKKADQVEVMLASTLEIGVDRTRLNPDLGQTSGENQNPGKPSAVNQNDGKSVAALDLQPKDERSEN